MHAELTMPAHLARPSFASRPMGAAHPARHALAAGAAVALMVACGGTIQPRGAAPPTTDHARADERMTVLVSSQLGAAGSGLSLYDALLRLQPALVQWSYRAGVRVDEQLPIVVIDGHRVGDVSALQRLPCSRVRKVLIIGGQAATARYGPGAGAGAILVTSAR